ncbi:MAG: hypothetical protein MJK15_00880 [Colwellia sp.]|nr:hypothetical protein [Colwellia sp.]
MIRVAMPGDTAQLVNVGRKIQQENLKYLRPDDKRMNALIVEGISSAQHLTLVSVNAEGEVVGGALVMTQPFAYAEKLHSHIVAVYTTVNGDTAEMVDHIVKWFEKRRASLLLCYAAPVETKLDRMLAAKRFKREGTMLIRKRYNGISK